MQEEGSDALAAVCNITIEVDDDVEYSTVAQRTGVVARAGGDFAQMLLQGVFMDEEARGGPGDGAVFFIEDLEHGDGFIYIAAFVPAADAVDVFELGSVRNLIGKNLHVDFFVKLDGNLAHAQRGLQGLLGLQVGSVHMEVVRGRAVNADGDAGGALDLRDAFQVQGEFTYRLMAACRNEQDGFGDGFAEQSGRLKQQELLLQLGSYGVGRCPVERLEVDDEAAAGKADVDAEGQTAVEEGLVYEFFAVREPFVQELGAAAFHAGMLLQELLLVDEDLRHLFDDAGDGENLLVGAGDAKHADGLTLYAQQEVRAAARADVFVVVEDAQLVEVFSGYLAAPP